MKLKRWNISNLTWDDSLLKLSPSKKPGQNILKLYDSGIKLIKDLLWILPLRVQSMPHVSSFSNLNEGSLFLGHGKIINIKLTPAFGRKGKGRVQLFNATVVVKDMLSDQYLNLKWFNSYPGLKKQLESLDSFTFMGEVQDYRGTVQIINPKINPKIDQDEKYLIEYPTVATVPGKYTKSLLNKIPKDLWSSPISYYPCSLEKELGLSALNDSFKILHGLTLNRNKQSVEEAKNRIIFDEFLIDQLKVVARKAKNKKLTAPQVNITNHFLEKTKKLFPYDLTADQASSLNEIITDLKSGHPMMRMLQGDVGCGKTTVAIVAAFGVINNGGQVALMCPTEALALQHFETLNNLNLPNIKISLLLGSTKSKEKKDIYEQLKTGEIQLLIGTHSLFQDAVKFAKLELAIIDEQHKFGVEQRQKLVSKGEGVHSLIMTATPIPRTLQLAQFGDLDISTIRTIPSNRKGIQTRIIEPGKYEKYLSFIKTRVSLKEQVYVVVPAISESETLDIQNVDQHLETYKRFFPDLKVSALHGQLKSDQKQLVLKNFAQGKIDILISTSVIEVGINVINSTVMAIYGPDRFGLSSLHQLRGRVGRGEKPGFCFLVIEKKISKEAMDRLKVVEKSTDGFVIAEADLKNRGEGDLFGISQSGMGGNKRLASIFEHFQIFEEVNKKVSDLHSSKPELFNPLIDVLVKDTKVSSTI